MEIAGQITIDRDLRPSTLNDSCVAGCDGGDVVAAGSQVASYELCGRLRPLNHQMTGVREQIGAPRRIEILPGIRTTLDEVTQQHGGGGAIGHTPTAEAGCNEYVFRSPRQLPHIGD